MRSDANAVDMQSLIVGAFMAIRYFYNSENTKHAAYEPRYLNTVSIPQIETGAFWYCTYGWVPVRSAAAVTFTFTFTKTQKLQKCSFALLKKYSRDTLENHIPSARTIVFPPSPVSLPCPCYLTQRALLQISPMFHPHSNL
jgi:hypothetical protein